LDKKCSGRISMKIPSRRKFVGSLAGVFVGVLPLAARAEANAGSYPQNGGQQTNPAGTDIQTQLADIVSKLAEIDKSVSLAGPIQSQLATIRDEVESIAARLGKTEPLIAARIQQLQNTIAEMKRGVEPLDPFA
jgi:hypothetical protein